MSLRLPAPHRILVVGTSGAGKSTLARRLAAALDLPHVELDALYWGPDWTPRADFEDSLRDAVRADGWVLDGSYLAWHHETWPRATALLWLDYGLPIVLARAIRRSWTRGLRREEVFGNRESLRRSFLSLDGVPWWAARTWARRRKEVGSLIALPEHRHLRVMHLTHPRQADDLARHLGALER